MTPAERALKTRIERDLPSPSQMEFVAARDRVLSQLRSTPVHLQKARIAETIPAVSAWRTALSLAAAAAVIVLVATVSIQRSNWLATVEAADGSRYTIDANTPLRSSDLEGTLLTLKDGSHVEMRSQSELTLQRADDGLEVRLQTGAIIVNAAKQRSGHLYVHTNDMTASVAGTVFLVNTAQDGSRVGVIEGEVRVRKGTVETTLRPGEQIATNPALAAPRLSEAVAWSRQANAYAAILAAFEKGITNTSGRLRPLNETPNSSVAAAGQAAATAGGPEFEEASIRQCDPENLPSPPLGARGGGANSLQMSPGHTYGLCLTLATLIRTAYGYAPGDFFSNGGRSPAMKPNIVYGLGAEDGLRVRGGPQWIRNERYTIEAVADGPANAETMLGPMLRALLERRFMLKAHIETENVASFALTAAPGGHKLREGTCTDPNKGGPPPLSPPSPAAIVRKNVDAIRRGATSTAPCGFGGAPNGPNILFVSAGAGLPPVREILGMPIINRTGIPLTVRYNYVLEFKPDDRTPGARGGIPWIEPDAQLAADPSSVRPAPDIFTALEQQLGLRLEPAQQPREYIVIDHVEKPSVN